MNSPIADTAPAPPAGAPANAFPAPPQQQEMPLARVRGEPLLVMPQDLYIPPDALEVILDAFEGPLDLLLYLIRRQNLDILDIPVAQITEQYVTYIRMMQTLQLELAAEYLVMAAILAEIKSRLLLPRPPQVDEEEADPRAELVRRLQEYERFKKAAERIDALPRLERDLAVAHVDAQLTVQRIPPEVDLRELLLALRDVLNRADLVQHHAVQRDALSVRSRMSELLRLLGDGCHHAFHSLFDRHVHRSAIVVTFLAMLELAREQLLEITQSEPLATIYVKSLAANSA